MIKRYELNEIWDSENKVYDATVISQEDGNWCDYKDVTNLMEQNKKLISFLEEAIYEGALDDTDHSSYYYSQIADNWKKTVLKYLEEIKNEY